MKLKKSLLLIVVFLISSIIGFNVYSEIDDRNDNKKIENMKKNNELTVEIKNTIEHKTVKMDNYEIHYYLSGKENDDVILFLHPAFSDHRAFDQQIDYFSEKYKVITVDLIGHGLSKANNSKDKIDFSTQHIEKIFEQEKVNKAHLVGVSIGSLLAQHFSLNNPDKTKSLTVLGGYNINKENKEIEKTQRSSNLGLIFRAIFSMKSFRKKVAQISCKTEKGRALFYKTTSHYKRKSFMKMQGLDKVVKNRENSELQCPIFILVGEYDIDLAKKMAKKWHDEMENSQHDTIKDAGHCANIDKPLVFNKIVKEFIDKNN